MDRYANKKCFDLKTTNLKTNRKSLGKCNPKGAMNGRQAESVIFAAKKLFQNKENGKMICGQFCDKRGFETVIDKGYGGESQGCVICGDTVCKVNFLKIPIESLIRFKQENYNCARIVRIFNELKTAFRENENVKIEIGNLKTYLTIEKQNNKYLLDLFEMPKNRILREIESLEMQSESIVKRYAQTFETSIDGKVWEKKYNKIQNSLEYFRKLLSAKQTSEQIKEYNQLKVKLSEMETEIKEKSKFKFPVLLSKSEANERIRNAEMEKSNYKKKGILKKVRATEYTLSLG